jgi:hypothetical protein
MHLKSREHEISPHFRRSGSRHVAGDEVVMEYFQGLFIDPLRNLKVSRPLGKVDNRSDGRGCKLGNLAIAVNLIV